MGIRSCFVVVACWLCVSGFAQNNKSGHFTSFDSTRIYYEVKGNGFPVLLVHGFTGTGEDWKKIDLYNQLVTCGFSVITVDLRGNGKSDKPHDSIAYLNDAEAKDLMGLIHSLGFKNYFALGYSRGSIILARLLVLDKHIQATVLGGMGADFTNPQWPRRIAFYNALMNDTTVAFAPFYKRIKENNLDQLALAYQQYGQPSTSKEELGRIRQKVLVVCGVEDKDNGKGQELAALIPNAWFVETPGTHGSAWHTPEFSATVVSFLQQNK
ncbi:alpha/beta fold hydrolase [Flavihumibacter fluvii]|uniref:alpha/beta fold hydrolase n=1 Tax=Flavihumibacter fluvii TaxID=2838157 RepID=UPI001BDEB012|nr:alpha/beta hydrolase [Flavihumibacter fluvii]ULQ52670.1 alpha/beta hydrolase [Flavihumibacter fluvii]